MKGSNRTSNRPQPVDLYIKPCILQMETVLSFQSHIYRNWSWTRPLKKSASHRPHFSTTIQCNKNSMIKSTSLHLSWMLAPWARLRGGQGNLQAGWRLEGMIFLNRTGQHVCAPFVHDMKDYLMMIFIAYMFRACSVVSFAADCLRVR